MFTVRVNGMHCPLVLISYLSYVSAIDRRSFFLSFSLCFYSHPYPVHQFCTEIHNLYSEDKDPSQE